MDIYTHTEQIKLKHLMSHKYKTLLETATEITHTHTHTVHTTIYKKY